MVNHSEFYYLNKHESSQYSQKPPGYLNIERLIKNQAPWKKYSLAKEPKPKALILTDWSAECWSQDKIDAVKCIFKQLIDDGFPLYVWQNREIIALSKETLHVLDNPICRQQISPVSYSVLVEEALKQHQLTRDKIHSLDDYWIDALLNIEDKNPERALSVSTFNSSTHNESDLISLLTQSSPPLTQIIHDEYSVKSHKSTLKLQKHFPNAIVSTHYRTICSDEHFELAGNFDFPKLHSSDLPNIHCYSYKSNQASVLKTVLSSDLYRLLSSLPALKTLNLTGIYLNGPFPAPVYIPTLKELRIEQSYISSDPLKWLLNSAPYLKILNIYDYYHNLVDINPISLPHLEDLKIIPHGLSFRAYESVSQATSLKKLTLCFLSGLDNLLLSRYNLSHLEELTLNQSSFENVSSILANATHLKHLSLSTTDVASNPTTPFPPLENLETFVFTNLKQNEVNAVAILSAAKHLKTLQLSSFRTFHFIPLADTMKDALATLEHLELTNNFITGKELYALLAATPALKKITLINNEHLDDFEMGSLSLKCLEEIEINQSNIKPTELLKMISNAPNLKALRIHSYEMDDLPEQLSRLDRLETLDLSGLSFSAEKLEQMLLKTKNIKQLDLAESDLTETDYVFTKPIFLKKLEKIIAWKTEIHDENMEILEQWVPNDESDDESDDASPLLDYRSKPIGVETQLTLDANTTLNPEKTFEVRHYFKSLYLDIPDPVVNDYRMQVFEHLQINPNPCLLNDAFVLNNEKEPSLSPYAPTLTSNIESQGIELSNTSAPGQYTLGHQTFSLTHQWQAIASLSAHETMTHVQFDSETNPSDIEFSYSERDNLYYIRTRGEACEVEIKFLLNIPPVKAPFVPLPDPIVLSINELLSYTSGDLILDKTTPTGEDYLHCLMQQKIGSCRHRVLVFKQRMQALYPEIPVRLIFNECHAFAEIQWEGLWRQVELGGYPSKINIHEPVSAEEDLSPSPPSLVNPYLKPLETWDKRAPSYSSVPAYCEAIFNAFDKKKQLIELTSSTDATAMQLNLQQYCQSISKPCFYIDSPDDLVCSASFIKRESGRDYGVSTRGPGGPLHDFLSQSYALDNPPVLIVNYDHFDADDIIRFNSLLDNQRFADGTPVSPDTFVIGVINRTKPDCYQGEDFYSRFDKNEECPLSSKQLNEALLPLPIRQKTEEDQETTIINLFNGNDWREQLLGYWTIQGDALIYVEGVLETALEKNLPIEFQNAPWDDEHFVTFWRQACLHQTIKHEHHPIRIPPSLQLLQNNGYHWQDLTENLTYDVHLTPHALVLNPGTLGEFFRRYRCDNEQKKLYSEPGYIEILAGQTLDINVTQNLGDDEWARILDACRKNRVTVNLHLAKGVNLPQFMTGELQSQSMSVSLSSWNGELRGATTVIKSSDVEHTVNELTLLDPDWLVLDITECEPDDLLTKIHHEYDDRTGQFVFKKINRVLLNAWSEHKKVILKGTFSPTLVDALAPILLERDHDAAAPGQLLLLSSDEPFNFLNTFEHRVTPEQKRDALLKQFSLDEVNALPDTIFSESFRRLQARLIYLRAHPKAISSDRAWDGLKSLSSQITLHDFNPLDSAKLTREFNEQRELAINQQLLHAPYVFITGLTAVGKTSFVEKFFNTDHNRLYQGMAAIKHWAEDQGPHPRKILFIDEANLNPSQWTAFEGLFNHPPGILIDGCYYPLSDQHKVVFAGNPTNYSDDRTLASFFTEHGNALVFDPLPQEFIFEDILKPAFENSRLVDRVTEICAPILDIYRFFCEHAVDSVLLSPRELQLIALLVQSYAYHQLASPEMAIKAAYHYAYNITVGLVPEQYRAEFDTQFKKPKKLPYPFPPQYSAVHEDFLITPSRQSILQQLDDLITLREYKRETGWNEEFFALTGMKSTFPAHNSIQRYGGLNGLVLEGEPGIGKSELVIAALHVRGYQQCLDYQDRPDKICPEKAYYVMPASMQIEDKKRLLLTAFHEGAVVVCDEMNGSPMMESFLNQLLMGKTPDNFPVGALGGHPPKKPGFLIIGTQNPPSNQGRNLPSNALARRLLTLSIPPYEHDEMIAILKSKGVNAEQSALLVDAYEENSHLAKRQHLNPKPTFRDLLHVATPWMRITRTEGPIPMSFEVIKPSKKRLASEASAASMSQLTRTTDRNTIVSESFVDQRFFTNKREPEDNLQGTLKYRRGN